MADVGRLGEACELVRHTGPGRLPPRSRHRDGGLHPHVLVGHRGVEFLLCEGRGIRHLEGEARVLGKTRSTLLAAAALIILTAGLCVLSTLMGWVFDRRRDFAIMKALGASGRLLGGFFAAEAAVLGATGALIGFVVGIGIAAWIGRVNFHAPVMPRLSVLPVVLAGSMAVTLLSAILPISLLRRVQPAVILRGE